MDTHLRAEQKILLEDKNRDFVPAVKCVLCFILLVSISFCHCHCSRFVYLLNVKGKLFPTNFGKSAPSMIMTSSPRGHFSTFDFFSGRVFFFMWMPNVTQLNSLSNHDERLLARAYNQQPRVLDGLILKRPSQCMSPSPQSCQIARRLSLCEKWDRIQRWSRYDVRHFTWFNSAQVDYRLGSENTCVEIIWILTIPW